MAWTRMRLRQDAKIAGQTIDVITDPYLRYCTCNLQGGPFRLPDARYPWTITLITPYRRARLPLNTTGPDCV